MESVNPFTGTVIKEYPVMDDHDVQSIVSSAAHAFADWSRSDITKRAEIMSNVSDILRSNQKQYATLITEEMGKLYTESLAEVDKCAKVCEYYATNAASFLADEPAVIEGTNSFVAYNPLGTVLAVMPWNFPFWQVFRFAAPALMAGNCVLLKHASNVCGAALAIEAIFKEAYVPRDVFRSLLIKSDQVGAIIEHKDVHAITLTGSTAAGKAVASKAGACLKKTVLELGGNDAYIILKDADLELAAEACVVSRMINAGQSCIAAKRFIVEASIHDAFVSLVIEKMKQKQCGNPMNADTGLAPLASVAFRDELHAQVQASISKGATCELGGTITDSSDAFYPATVLTHVIKGMPAYDDELFGPVSSIITVKDEAEAIGVANDSVFGLGAAVFTKNVEHGLEIARNKIHAGACFINDFVKSDPRLPFGGIKESGYGRELAEFGIREFVNIKAVSAKF